MFGFAKKLLSLFLVAVVVAGTWGVSLCIHSDGGAHLFSGTEHSAVSSCGNLDGGHSCVDLISDFNPDTVVEDGCISVGVDFVRLLPQYPVPRNTSKAVDSVIVFKTAPPDVRRSGIRQNTELQLII